MNPFTRRGGRLSDWPAEDKELVARTSGFLPVFEIGMAAGKEGTAEHTTLLCLVFHIARRFDGVIALFGMCQCPPGGCGRESPTPHPRQLWWGEISDLADVEYVEWAASLGVTG